MAKRENKKEQLKNRAVELMLKGSYESTSMRDLAKAVGIQAPGIYHYFDSKEDILREINDESWAMFREHILSEVEAREDPEDKIRVYIRNMIKYQLLLGQIAFVVDDTRSLEFIKSTKTRYPEIAHLVRDILADLTASKGIDNGIDPTVAAHILNAAISRIYRWYDPKGRISLDELTDQVTRLFFRGFLAAPPAKR
jgi:AcrR family transcriptional regulator